MSTTAAVIARPHWLRLVASLTRPRVTAAVMLTTATGYFLATHSPDGDLLFALLGVYLLASGSTALNQCQERRIDARMERTRHRPLPSGMLDLPTALFLAGVLCLLGLTALASVAHQPLLLAGLGLAALAWYNGLYTYLKRLTAFAVVPGALIGAIPPAIGYVAGSGELSDGRILLPMLFFTIWQIPHFWLLLLLCGEQYARAGLPSLTRLFSPPQLGRVTFVWIAATAVAGLTLPASPLLHFHWLLNTGLVLASCWLVGDALVLVRTAPLSNADRTYRRLFARINIYAVFVMMCLSLANLPAA